MTNQPKRYRLWIVRKSPSEFKLEHRTIIAVLAELDPGEMFADGRFEPIDLSQIVPHAAAPAPVAEQPSHDPIQETVRAQWNREMDQGDKATIFFGEKSYEVKRVQDNRETEPQMYKSAEQPAPLTVEDKEFFDNLAREQAAAPPRVRRFRRKGGFVRTNTGRKTAYLDIAPETTTATYTDGSKEEQKHGRVTINDAERYLDWEEQPPGVDWSKDLSSTSGSKPTAGAGNAAGILSGCSGVVGEAAPSSACEPKVFCDQSGEDVVDLRTSDRVPRHVFDAACRERDALRKENADLKRQAADNSDFMAYMHAELSGMGCKCGPEAHAATPPMMWPEWIGCIINTRTEQWRDKLTAAEADLANLRAKVSDLPQKYAGHPAMTNLLKAAHAAAQPGSGKGLAAAERQFPIQRTYRPYHEKEPRPYPPRIPWSVAELAYSVYRDTYGSSQSLERLAERGGFAPEEMDQFLPDWRERESASKPLLARLTKAEAAAERGVRIEAAVTERIDGRSSIRENLQHRIKVSRSDVDSEWCKIYSARLEAALAQPANKAREEDGK